MANKKPTPQIYLYVLGVYKGEGKALGNIATEARVFEEGMNDFIDKLELKEGIEQ